MINKVVLEGRIVRGSWGVNKDQGGYFITISQDTFFNKFKRSYMYFAYANQPLANELAKIVSENPECSIVFEGKLKTYLQKTDNIYRTTVLIQKIINWSPKKIESQDTTTK